jgi:hypothetical protein
MIDSAPLFALGITLAWLAGVRVYLTVFGLGVAALFGWVALPDGLDVVKQPLVIGVAFALAVVEFFADKIPGVDTGWDLLHTLVRVPAGAFLAAHALAPGGDPGVALLAAGGGVALTSHLLKSGTRALLNTSPEPISNWSASFAEDLATLSILGIALAYPWLALALVVILTLMLGAILWWVVRWFRRRRRVVATVSRA